MQILSKRHRKSKTEYSLDFYHPDEYGYGYSFPCDKDGNVLFASMNEVMKKNYQDCINGIYNLVPQEIKENTWSWVEPTVGKCERCGRKIQLVDDYCGATECECGQWYAIGGYAISPPQMWEEPIEYAY